MCWIRPSSPGEYPSRQGSGVSEGQRCCQEEWKPARLWEPERFLCLCLWPDQCCSPGPGGLFLSGALACVSILQSRQLCADLWHADKWLTGPPLFWEGQQGTGIRRGLVFLFLSSLDPLAQS